MLSYTHCTLCPRRCGVDRTGDSSASAKCRGRSMPPARASITGRSRSFPAASAAARSFLRLHAEMCLCQNYDISQENFGKPLTSAELRAAFERLIDDGVQNINLVTPTHFLPTFFRRWSRSLPVPDVVYNCGGYESVVRRRCGKAGREDRCLSSGLHAGIQRQACKEAVLRAGLFLKRPPPRSVK